MYFFGIHRVILYFLTSVSLLSKFLGPLSEFMFISVFIYENIN